MSPFFLPSLIALLIQAAGALLLASLCLVLYRTARSAALGLWAAAWLVLSLSVAIFWAGLSTTARPTLAASAYVLGEYGFGYLVLAGCWAYAELPRPSTRDVWLLIPGLVLAGWLPRAGHASTAPLVVHTLIVAAFFVASLRAIRNVAPTERRLPGLRVMQAALSLLTLDYLHYAPVSATLSWQHASMPAYWQYWPLYDLLFEVMLMFGMVMVVTGDIRHQLEVANENLAQARDRFAAMAQIDHLTSALNRHVFHALVQGRGGSDQITMHGCIAMIDVDDLKAVNDHFGHPAGDAAIRAVASAIRHCIRADDLLFRWGGDEFLVVLFGVAVPEARSRFAGLGTQLRGTTLAGTATPVDLSAAVGLAPFAEAASFDDVIALADAMMYGAKKRQLVT